MIITLEKSDIEDAIKSHLVSQGIEVNNFSTKIDIKRIASGGLKAVVNLNADTAEVSESGSEESKQEDSSDGKSEKRPAVFG